MWQVQIDEHQRLIASLMRNRRQRGFFSLQLMFPSRQPGGLDSLQCTWKGTLKQTRWRWSGPAPSLILGGLMGTTHLKWYCTVSVGVGGWGGSTGTECRKVLEVSGSNHGLRNHIDSLLLALRARQQARVCGPEAPWNPTPETVWPMEPDEAIEDNWELPLGGKGVPSNWLNIKGMNQAQEMIKGIQNMRWQKMTEKKWRNAGVQERARQANGSWWTGSYRPGWRWWLLYTTCLCCAWHWALTTDHAPPSILIHIDGTGTILQMGKLRSIHSFVQWGNTSHEAYFLGEETVNKWVKRQIIPPCDMLGRKESMVMAEPRRRAGL